MPFSALLSQNSEVIIVGGQYGVRNKKIQNENEKQYEMKIIQKTENEKKGMSQRLKKRQNMREEQGINKKRGKAN